MNRFVRVAIAVALASVTALPAMADAQIEPRHTSNFPSRAVHSWDAQSAADLSRLPDANSLVAAAALTSDASAKMTLLDRAAKADPTSADISAMVQMTCASTPGCSAASGAGRLRVLDPDNALGWLPELRMARDQGNEAQVTQLLLRMAQSPQFRTYRAEVTNRFGEALQAVPQNPDPLFHAMRGPTASRLATARFLSDLYTSVPAFMSIMQSCMPSAPQHPQRRAACQRIGVLLESADGYLANRIGLRVDRLNAADAADYARIVAKARQFDWRYSYYSGFIQAMHPDDYADFARSQQQLRSFSAAMGALLTQHGVPLDPPASWVDKVLAYRVAQDSNPVM